MSGSTTPQSPGGAHPSSAPSPGDYGVVDGKGIVSATIRLFTRSRYSHAFIVMENGLVIESEREGAKWAPLSKYDGQVVAYNYDEPLTYSQRQGIMQHAKKLVGTPYGFLDIVALGLSSLGLNWKWLTNRAEHEDALICSQLVARCYWLGADVDLADGRLDAQVTPGDLADRITRRVWAR